MKEAVQKPRADADRKPERRWGKRSACFLSGCLMLAFFAGTAAAQVRLSPEQVNARKQPDYTPALAGQTVIVQGVVSSPAFHFPGYTLLIIEQDHHGAAVEVAETDRDIESYRPGDQLEVEGTVGSRAGMVVILPSHIRAIGR